MTDRKDYNHKYYLEHKKYFYDRSLAWAAKNREKVRAIGRAVYAANKGSSIARHEQNMAKLEERAGCPRSSLCDVCGGKNDRRFEFDHDHRTGEFRGWLCRKCNLALGNVNDDIEILEKLIVYLARSRRPKLVSTRSR